MQLTRRSHARGALAGAVSESDLAEVMVCMFGPTSDTYGLLHRGTRVRKMHSSYRSTFSSNASRSIYTDVRGYSLHNIRFGFRDDSLDIFGWVRNAFDQNYYESLAVTPGNTGLISAQLGDPRTFGGTVSFRF